MALYMVKVKSSDDDSTAWFLVSAYDEAELRELFEDCTSHIVELIDNPADIEETVRKEFDRVALFASI